MVDNAVTRPKTREPITNEDEQAEVIAFLASPGVLDPLSQDPPEVRVTHASRLFMTKAHAFKLKRARHLPFLDFTDPDDRHAICLHEVDLNRRTAPDTYLGVNSVTREADGRLALDGNGPAVDWLVAMHRFDDSLLANKLARDGRFGVGDARALADQIIDFHARVEPRPDKGGHDAMVRAIRNVISAMANSGNRVLIEVAEELAPPILRQCNRHHALLDARRKAGYVRLCHGDMHLGNICMIADRPTPFDCIEFDDDIACVDVLYDLAFPVMDLVHFGRRQEAQALLSRYLAATRDYAGLALMPLFLGARALIRAMAEGLAGNIDTARDYARLADEVTANQRPRLVAVGGLSGSGKSTVAYNLALTLAAGPGAVVLRSDEIRKRMFDAVPEDRLGADAYLQAASRTMYSRMGADAAAALDAGWPVVADATFMAAHDRDAIQTVARNASVPFTGIWLDAPADVLRARVAGRVNDASDADVAILDRQLDAKPGTITWTTIDASGDQASVADLAARAL